MTNFKLLGTFDPAPALAEVQQSKLWNWFNLRRLFSGSGHSDVDDIVMRFQDVMKPITREDIFDGMHTMSYFPWFSMTECQRVADLVPRECNGLGRVMIASLKPRGCIAKHIDEGKYAENHERIHFVLQSNPHVAFVCGNETVEMKAGEAWWFNHREPHYVVNGGDEPRIHLIVDCLKS